MKKLIIIGTILLLNAAVAQHSPLYINEFMPLNMTAYENRNGDFVDWIEIYNSGATPVDLAGYYLTDDITGGNYWQIQAGDASKTTVPAHGFRMLIADEATTLGADHIGFKLNADHGKLILIGADNATIVDSVSYGGQSRDISYGRYPDGGTWGYMAAPTPARADTVGYPAMVSHPSIVQAAGVYTSVSVTIQPADAVDIIRYTLDGSDPTESSAPYVGPIAISRTSILKARSFRAGYHPSTIKTKAFVVASHTLPILTLMSDPNNLFSRATGIYVNDGDGRSWERFGEFEYFENGVLSFHIPSGIRLQGNSGPAEYNKRSFRAFFRDGYGEERLSYPIFRSDPVTSFASLVLRSGYDDDLESRNRYSGTLIRDPLVERLWRKMGGLSAMDQFAILYINTEYYGIYDLKESIGEDFICDHLGYRNIDLIRTRWDSTEVQAGDKVNWNEMLNFFRSNSFETDAKLAGAAQYLDLDNYINLQALVQATQFQSWAYGTFFYRNRSSDVRWKVTIWDEDRTYTDVNWNGFISSYNPIADTLNRIITRKLLQNQLYKTAFINRLADLLNTTLSAAGINTIIDSLTQAIQPEIPSELARWDTTGIVWNDRVNLVRDFAARRPAIVRQQMQDYFGLAGKSQLAFAISGNGKIIVNTVTIDSPSWSGTYFRGVPVTVKAVPDPGYRFAGWNGSGVTSEASVTLNLSGDTTLTALFTQAGSSNAELVAPSRIKPGYPLPLVVRIRNAEGNINPIDQSPVTATFGGVHADTVIAIKRGAGTGVVHMNATGPFVLSVSSAHASVVTKQIGLSTVPVQSYSGTLSTGDIEWDNTSDRLITANLTIPSGCHLTIKTGTWVLLKRYVNVYVQGELTVEGSASDPVVITPDVWSEPWGGFEFDHGTATFEYCMVVNGGGDLSKGYPTSEGWHTGHQHMFFGKNNSEFNFNQCFFLNSSGKVFGMQDGVATVSNSVSSFVWHGGEFHRVLLRYTKSHIMNVPDDNNETFTEDIDTDGFHIDYVNPLHPEYSVIDSCYFITGKDDAIDHHASRLTVSNCWLEEWVHEGVAASGGDTIRVFNTVALNNDQGFEAGNSDANVNIGPFVYVDHCVAVGNNHGLRVGDSYSGLDYRDVMKVTNTIVYNNGDNIMNFLNGTQAPLPGALEISYSMTNDADYDGSPHCITGVPNFDPYYYLNPGSPGTNAGMRGTNMGRTDVSAPEAGSIVINEIMYNAPAIMDTKDWIELYNPYQSAQDVSGWILKDDDDLHSFVLPSGTSIPAKRYLVLCADTANFHQIHPDIRNAVGNISFGFGGNDQVRLFTPGGHYADSVGYSNTSPWPESADGGGYSIALKGPSLDRTLPSSWNRSGQFGGSPGRENLSVNTVEQDESGIPTEYALDQNYPNPFNLSTMIRFALPRQTRVELEIFDILGRRIAVLVSGRLAAGRYSIAWNADRCSSGLFFCRLRAENFVSVKKLILLK